MAELVDAHGSGPCKRKFLQVQVLLSVPEFTRCSSAWQSATFGTWKPQVQVLSPRPFFYFQSIKPRCLIKIWRHRLKLEKATDICGHYRYIYRNYFTKDTSFRDIAGSLEWWVLFGIIIITNSKSPTDSALKCFVFFLISQPLVYLVQVPFSPMGFGLFNYYTYRFILTLFTLPMGYIGYYIKKETYGAF